MLDDKFPEQGLAREQIFGVQTVGYLAMEGEMADSAPVRRRQLGMELRRLREDAGKIQADAAEWTGLGESAISKIERGKQKISAGHLKLLCQLYDVRSPHAQALEQLRKEAEKRGWWAVYGDDVPDWFRGYLGMETAAAEVWFYASELIPGLLQTVDYTKAITAAMDSGDAERAERYAAVRLARQKRLTDDDPLILRVVINEAAIRRPVGGPEVMRAQLDRLVDTARLPNVTVQLLPFSAGEHPAMLGAFSAIRFPQEEMNVVYLESNLGALYFERPSQVEWYTHTFERLTSLALTSEATIDVLVSR